MPLPLRATIWNEFLHEQTNEKVRAVYPDGIHAVIAEGLHQCLGDAVAVRTATLDEPEHGLSEVVLDQTDVLVWWGHIAHDRVEDGQEITASTCQHQYANQVSLHRRNPQNHVL